ncbi:thiamine pyrophosphate-dependent dehydrogenase E1 component subunit alpha [Sphingomonas sp. 37zxx]|uniref:thiamine pyrophosphate-dependent dehydrogenase E1 component subunit alpha n=1 Tax=Sphingomonas sp. 37zxx TaxID=1550073 RepID=UPI00068CC8D2|nr:thiamine pyrophosphate-dependent dehydrogenase E1 component subunit alpha [Sphingomonas sp. 37zxx]
MAPSAPERSRYLDIYTRMTRIHRSDERFRRMLLGGQLAIAYYSPRGQELLSAALMAAVRQDDYLVTTYRGIHDQLAKGIPVRDLWAEFAGKATGTCKGKGGPMHITHPETGVMVTTGIVGSGLPIANGLAWASMLKGEDRVTVCCFGDGATNIGAFHEALNMASVWKLPVVFVCQNNRYAEKTKFADGTACATISDRAIGYGLEAIRIDGNDADAMYDAAARAVAKARAGDGPSLIEAMTFRFMGHSFGDPGEYIPKEEYAAFLAIDPVPAYRQKLLDLQIGEQELGAIDAQILAELEDAVTYALESPYAGEDEILKDVLDVEITPAISGETPFQIEEVA